MPRPSGYTIFLSVILLKHYLASTVKFHPHFSCGPGMSEKVSRRAILDRSLHYDPKLEDSHHDQDDIWYSSSKLFEDHVSEIHGKWDAIEDDIWGKVIVMERNRRVAKAYVRSPVVSVGGGKEGFDGLRVGLQGFDNPFRDEETRAVLSRYGGLMELVYYYYS